MKKNVIFLSFVALPFVLGCNNNPQPTPTPEVSFDVSIVSNTLAITKDKVSQGTDLACFVVLKDDVDPTEYAIPDYIDSIKVGNDILDDTKYTYNSNSGSLKINKDNINGNIEVTAEAKHVVSDNCVLKFDARGGSFDYYYSKFTFEMNVKVGTKFSDVVDFVKTPTALGNYQDFTGWSVSKEEFEAPLDDFIINDDTTVYAFYTTDYDVKLNFNDSVLMVAPSVAKEEICVSDEDDPFKPFPDKPIIKTAKLGSKDLDDFIKDDEDYNKVISDEHYAYIEIHFTPKEGYEDSLVTVNWDDGLTETVKASDCNGVLSHSYLVNENTNLDVDVTIFGELNDISLTDQEHTFGMFDDFNRCENSAIKNIYFKDVNKINDYAFDFFVNYGDDENPDWGYDSNLKNVIVEKEIEDEEDAIKISSKAFGDLDAGYHNPSANILFAKSKDVYAKTQDWANILKALNQVDKEGEAKFESGYSYSIDVNNALFCFDDPSRINDPQENYYYYNDVLRPGEAETIFVVCFNDSKPTDSFHPVITSNYGDKIFHYTEIVNENSKVPFLTNKLTKNGITSSKKLIEPSIYKVMFGFEEGLEDKLEPNKPVEFLINAVEDNKYQLTLDPNGGIWQNDDNSDPITLCEYSTRIIETIENYEKEFQIPIDIEMGPVMYWSKDKEGNQPVSHVDILNKDITVYAQYGKMPKEEMIPLIIDPNGGCWGYELLETEPRFVNEILPNRIRCSYLKDFGIEFPTYYDEETNEFIQTSYFTSDKEGKNIIKFNDFINPKPGEDSITIYAQYDTVKITLNAFDGTYFPNHDDPDDPTKIEINVPKGINLLYGLKTNGYRSVDDNNPDDIRVTNAYTYKEGDDNVLIDQNFVVDKDIELTTAFEDEINIVIDFNGGRGIYHELFNFFDKGEKVANPEKKPVLEPEINFIDPSGPKISDKQSCVYKNWAAPGTSVYYSLYNSMDYDPMLSFNEECPYYGRLEQEYLMNSYVFASKVEADGSEKHCIGLGYKDDGEIVPIKKNDVFNEDFLYKCKDEETGNVVFYCIYEE